MNVTAHASHSHHQVVDKLMALVTSQGGLNKPRIMSKGIRSLLACNKLA